MYLLVSLSGQVSPLISCDLALICTFEFENVSLSLYVGSRKRQLALAFHVWVCLQNTHLFRETQYVEADLNKKGPKTKDFRAALVRHLTAATAAITAFLFVEMLCYVLGRLHSSCVLCTKIGLHV